MKNVSFFKIVATSVFLAFMVLMGFVTFVSYTRHSGQTGLDMGKIQKMRYELKSS